MGNRINEWLWVVGAVCGCGCTDVQMCLDNRMHLFMAGTEAQNSTGVKWKADVGHSGGIGFYPPPDVL